MKNVLSIDFDYFIDTDANTREEKFPDGIDQKDFKELLLDWEHFRKKFPEIEQIGILEREYEIVLENIKTCLLKKKAKVYVAGSHKEIEKCFYPVEHTRGQSFNITHIDFHHDHYLGANPNKLDCSNWLRLVMNDYPHSHVTWIRREDSETSSLLGDYPYESQTELEFLDNYDTIFLCLSPEWTPPHLVGHFRDMCFYIESCGVEIEYLP